MTDKLDRVISGAIDLLIKPVNLELLAQAEHHRGMLNGEVKLTDPAQLGSWIHSSALAIADSLDEWQYQCNPVDPDYTADWTTVSRALNSSLVEDVTPLLEKLTGVIKCCTCCHAAYTKTTWKTLPEVSGFRDGLNVRNCPCRASGATLAVEAGMAA